MDSTCDSAFGRLLKLALQDETIVKEKNQSILEEIIYTNVYRQLTKNLVAIFHKELDFAYFRGLFKTILSSGRLCRKSPLHPNSFYIKAMHPHNLPSLSC